MLSYYFTDYNTKKYNQQGSSSILNNFYHVFRKSALSNVEALFLMLPECEVSTQQSECERQRRENSLGKSEGPSTYMR